MSVDSFASPSTHSEKQPQVASPLHGTTRASTFATCALLAVGLIATTPVDAAEKIRIASAKAAAKRPQPERVKVPRSSARGQLQIVVSIPHQRIDVFDGTVRVASSRVSTGKKGHRTPEGVFSVIQKNRRHYSNLYHNAPMPYMQRLTWSGIALHAGVVPRYPASHGCIRMPHKFARQLFGMTRYGAHIIVNRGRQSPQVIDHKSLFHPQARPVRRIAASIAEMTLDETETDQGGKNDLAAMKSKAVALRDKQAERFAKELRRVFHPNFGASPRAHIRLTQRLLVKLDYGIKHADGDLGRKSRRAIRAFQRDHGMPVTGRPSPALSERLYRALGLQMVFMDPAEADKLLVPAAVDDPLRVLITRRLKKDDIKRAQTMLDKLGYSVGWIDGAMGRTTRSAINEFKIENGLEGEPVVDDILLQALAKATGEPSGTEANGRIFIRQGHRDIYEAPITIRNADTPLGTHVFSSMGYDEERSAPVTWTALTVAERNHNTDRKNRRQASASKKNLGYRITDAQSALDRITVPEDVRAYVEQNLTPGSSLIITDHGSSHETGEGTDFIVLTK